MDALKCEALLKAVDTGSLSAAAAEMGYTPSGIARMVNALEAEVGFPLITRSPRGVALTADGERMQTAIREIVRWNEQASQISAEICGLSTGKLAIGTYYSIAACWLPEIIKEFQTDYPNIRINTLEGSNNDLAAWLEERRVDCCFLSERSFNGDWIPLKQDALVVWLPKNHPKANLSAFPLRDLDGAPFIDILPGLDTDNSRLLTAEGLSPDIRFTTIDSYTTYSMVAAGLGISFNNELMAKNWRGDVVVLPFDPPRYITLGIAVPSLKDASPAARKFISYAKRMIS